MKKTAAFILSAVLLFCASGSAFAGEPSVKAPIVSSEITADLPETVETQLEVKTFDELTVEEQQVLEVAIDTLADIVPEDTTVRNLNMVVAEERVESITLDMKNIKELDAKQLVDGEWVAVEVVEEDGGVFTVSLAGDSSVSVSFKLDSETNRPTEQFINGKWEKIDDLGNDDGIYTIVVSATYPASVTMKIDDVENVSAKQFIDGEWIDVSIIRNPDGTYTVTVNGPGFLAVLTK